MVWAGEWRGMDRLAGVVGTYEECDFLNEFANSQPCEAYQPPTVGEKIL
jgi:hypothetical protein